MLKFFKQRRLKKNRFCKKKSIRIYSII